MSGSMHYGPCFAVIRDKALEEHATTVLFSPEIKKICRENKVCFLKSENGEVFPFVIIKKDPCYSPPNREIFEVGRYVIGCGAIGFVNEIEIERLNSGNLTLKHFLDLYEKHDLALSKGEIYELIDFVEEQEKNDWKNTLGEESFDEDFYARYGRGRFSTEPATGFRENLFRKTKTDKGTGVIFGYVHKEFGNEQKEEFSKEKNMLELIGKNGLDVLFKFHTNSISRKLKVSRKVCLLYTREEFMERLLVAEKNLTRNIDPQKILDNFEAVEEFFGRPLKPIFLERIAKQIASGDRERICEYRVAKDYDKNSFTLVFKNGVPPDVKSVVVAKNPDEVPKFLGRLMFYGPMEKDRER